MKEFSLLTPPGRSRAHNQLGHSLASARWTSRFACRPCPRRYVSTKNIVLAAIFALFATVSVAVEIKPYPVANITEEEWQTYYETVNAEIGASGRAYENERLEVFTDEKTRASIAFTMKGHPAHPAWVTRYVAFEDGELIISAIGYFAGSEDAFKVLFGQYMELVEEARKRFAQ